MKAGQETKLSSFPAENFIYIKERWRVERKRERVTLASAALCCGDYMPC